MIIVMKKKATKEEIAAVLKRANEEQLSPQVNSSQAQVIIGLAHLTKKTTDIAFNRYKGVEKVVPITNSYKLTSRAFHPDDTIIQLGALKIGNGHFVQMAGPCSVESYDQIMKTAEIVKKGGGQILRGGAFKPRTSPYAFQGLKEKGLHYLRQAGDAFDLKVVTEVMDENHIELVGEYTDIFQIGARNMQNFSLLKAIGKTKQPVVLKRGLSATIDEWLNAAEYITTQGNQQVMFMERGIRTFETKTRNTLDLSAIPLMKELTHFPVLFDPSHGTGRFELVCPMAKAGLVAGADGMMVELHPDPKHALSDGQQSLKFSTYLKMTKELTMLQQAIKQMKEVSL